MGKTAPKRRYCVALQAAALMAAGAVTAGQSPTSLSKALDEYRQGRYEQARTLLLAALTANEQDAGALHLLGLVEMSSGAPDQARKHLEASVRFAPDEPSFAINLARVLIRQGNKGEARDALTRSTASAPHPESYELLGLLWLQDDQSSQALSSFTRSIGLDPSRTSARYYLGLTQQSLGDFDTALETYATVLAKTPSDFHSHLQSAKIYLIRGDLSRAEPHLIAAEKEIPSSGSVQMHWSRLHLDAGKLELALQAANKAVELSPGDAQSHYQLGQVLARLGRVEEAKREQSLFEKHRVSAESRVELWRQSER